MQVRLAQQVLLEGQGPRDSQVQLALRVHEVWMALLRIQVRQGRQGHQGHLGFKARLDHRVHQDTLVQLEPPAQVVVLDLPDSQDM